MMKPLLGGLIALTVASSAWIATPVRAVDPGLADLQTDLRLRILPPPGRPGHEAVFGIVKENAAANSAVSYQLGAPGGPGELQIRISDVLPDGLDGGLDNPLFCFDFGNSGADAQVLLAVTSMGAATALQGIGLGSALQYHLGNLEIAVAMPSSVQCFYQAVIAEQPAFGLFGQPPSPPAGGGNPGNPDVLFGDGFEAELGLDIAFNPSQSGSSGQLTYELVVTNTGQATLSNVAFQEIFPAQAALYPAALEGGTPSCTADAAPGTELLLPDSTRIRLENQSIGPGQRIVCTVTRTRVGSGQARLFAGVVAGPGAGAVFAADVAVVEVGVQ